MHEEPTPLNLRLEAQRTHQVIERLNIPGLSKPGERIASQPREAYHPSPSSRRMASPGEIAELDAILGELWAVNQEHIGEPTLEVEAYYALTGHRQELTERFIAWCRRLFERRTDPGSSRSQRQG
jgi:hypothetical protein